METTEKAVHSARPRRPCAGRKRMPLDRGKYRKMVRAGWDQRPSGRVGSSQAGQCSPSCRCSPEARDCSAPSATEMPSETEPLECQGQTQPLRVLLPVSSRNLYMRRMQMA